VVDLKLPELHLKIPSLPPVNRKKVLAALCIVFGVIGLCIGGWTLYHSLHQQHEVRALAAAVASSEADLAGLDREVSALLMSVSKNPSLRESDSYMDSFGSLAERGMAITARHRQAIDGIEVPETYADLKAAYLQALGHLNNAYTLWSASATAYDLRHYTAAEKMIGEADQEWQAYELAIGDYNRQVALGPVKM
jgi:hypothetical protein